MAATTLRSKTVSISSKRQFTIPQSFYQLLGFSNKAVCELRGHELVIRPIADAFGEDFSEQILKELVEEGRSGKELLDEFKKRRSQVRPAVQNMLAEAGKVAEGKAAYATMDEIFDEADTND